MKLCEKCNKINVDEATHCRYCGEPLKPLERIEKEIPFGFSAGSDFDDSINNAEKFSIESTKSVKPPVDSVKESETFLEDDSFLKSTPISKSEPSKSVNPTFPKPELPKVEPSKPTYFEHKSSKPSLLESEPTKPNIEDNNKKIKSPGININPILDGNSITYKAKIDAYSGIDKIKCPKCGSDNLSFVSNTQKRGFSAGNACCGYMLLGPLGILCGASGSNKTSTSEFWVCGNCGNHFQSSAGNAEKEKIRRYANILSVTPDNVIDNVSKLLIESDNEVNKFKDIYSEAKKAEYRSNIKLKLYSIVAIAITIMLIILTILILFVFDVESTIKIVTVPITISIIVVTFVMRSAIENKFASEEYRKIVEDYKTVRSINSRLKEISEAKTKLSSMRII